MVASGNQISQPSVMRPRGLLSAQPRSGRLLKSMLASGSETRPSTSTASHQLKSVLMLSVHLIDSCVGIGVDDADRAGLFQRRELVGGTGGHRHASAPVHDVARALQRAQIDVAYPILAQEAERRIRIARAPEAF